MTTLDKEIRRSLGRVRRAVEKAGRELDGLEGTIRRAEAGDFPVDAYQEARARMAEVLDFVDEESTRLRMKLLETGGIEPGRVRRSSGA